MTHKPLASFALLLSLPLSLAACSSGESARDQALAGLERASQAAGLEAEMAGLVAELPDDSDAAGAEELQASVDELDSEAEELLASADSGEAYDEKISAAVEETRGAGTELAAAASEPAAAGEAKQKAVRRLQASNDNLGGATELIGTELQDEQGNLSAEDAEALEAVVADVDEAGAAVASVSEPQDCGFIVFTPNSDDVANDIRAVGIACEEARDLLMKSNGGEIPSFSCSSTEITTGLAGGHYTCESEGRRIEWDRH